MTTRCKHKRTWFDRTISYSQDSNGKIVEDGMKTRCSDCGIDLDAQDKPMELKQVYGCCGLVCEDKMHLVCPTLFKSEIDRLKAQVEYYEKLRDNYDVTVGQGTKRIKELEFQRASLERQVEPLLRNLAQAASHWSVCDMPAELEFKCKECIKGEEALKQFRQYDALQRGER